MEREKKGFEGLKQFSDEELVIQSLNGHKECFSTLVDRYYKPVYGFVFNRIDRYHEIDDLVQETFIEAFKSLKSCQKPAQFRSWLFGIANNRLGKYRRTKQHVLISEKEIATFDEQVDELVNTSFLLEKSISQLPESIQQILKMKHWENLSCEEIAGKLGCPVGTVWSHLSRAYRTLRNHLASNK